jgi:ribose-phosphate pyrophosphokinase
MFYVNEVPIKPTIFPDGTSQIWNLPNQLCDHKQYTIRWKFDSEGEITHLAQLYDLLSHNTTRISLYFDYLPYGRQDKEISNDTTFALRSFAKLINSMSFKEITIMDPHSSVATDILMAKAVYPIEMVEKVMLVTGSDGVCYPDKGAFEKYTKIYQYAELHGNKVRDQKTGKITSYELADSQFGAPCGFKVLIVDDICDGGATFVLLAKALYERGAKEVNLFVTHGIFSKGLAPLQEAGIKRIFTQDGEACKGIQNQIAYRRL